jgi:hypothetical protein
VFGDPSVLSPSQPPCNPALSSDSASALITGDEDNGGNSNEVGRFFSGSEPSSSSSPPLDLRDAAVARVPTSSGVLFPPPSGELEGDGLGAVLYVFLLFLPYCNMFFDVATYDF